MSELVARLRATSAGLCTEDPYMYIGRGNSVGLALEAAERIEALEAENAELNAMFDLQWDADMRAIKMWQEANPGNERVWPDAAHLGLWLMCKVEALEKERDDARACGAEARIRETKAEDARVSAVQKASLLEVRVAALEQVLREVLPFMPNEVLECHGHKCRYPWCASCYDDAEAGFARAKAATDRARAALGENNE